MASLKICICNEYICLDGHFNASKDCADSACHICSFSLVSYYNAKKVAAYERFEQASKSPVSASSVKAGPAPAEPDNNEVNRPVDFQVTDNLPNDCYPRDRLTATDLLPKDAANSKWAQVNPAGQGDLKDQNFLTAGFHIGVDTQGQSLRNPNLQIRAEPPNPQSVVSPWNQTTITPDTNQKPLC